MVHFYCGLAFAVVVVGITTLYRVVVVVAVALHAVAVVVAVLVLLIVATIRVAPQQPAPHIELDPPLLGRPSVERIAARRLHSPPHCDTLPFVVARLVLLLSIVVGLVPLVPRHHSKRPIGSIPVLDTHSTFVGPCRLHFAMIGKFVPCIPIVQYVPPNVVHTPVVGCWFWLLQ